jgi:hypothetical protein
MAALTPNLLLIYITLAIILFNIFTLKFRDRNLIKFERKLTDLSEKNIDGMTLEEIARELQMPIYDAKILTRKIASKGKLTIKTHNEEEFYSFK